MGNKKNIILVVVILLFVIGTVAVLYGGFSGPSTIIEGDPDIEGTQKEIVQLLPYGNKLDFEGIKSWDEGSAKVEFRELDPTSVGVDVRGLISPNFGSTGAVTTPQGFLDNPAPIRSQRSGG